MTATTDSPTTAAPPPPPGGALWSVSDAWLLAGRNMRHIQRRPDQLMAAVLQPIMFFVLFAYVFGGAIQVPGGDYKQFLLPGVFGQVIVFGGMAGMCVGIAEDMRNGMMDRFRSLPLSHASVLVGRTLSEVVRNIIALIVTGAVGFAFGFRFHGGVLHALAGAGVLLLFGFALSWVLACIGITASSAEAAQTTSMPWLFLLGFVSSAFVPTSAMPGWLRVFADHTPVTLTIDSARAWFNGGTPGSEGWQSIVWSAGLLVVFVPLATRLFRRAVAA